MNYCDKCGGPLRDCNDPDRRDLDQGEECRLCVLEWWAEDNRPLWAWSGTEEAANSTANTPATSMWLPPGQREALLVTMANQDRALSEWLRISDPAHGIRDWVHEFWGFEGRTGQA